MKRLYFSHGWSFFLLALLVGIMPFIVYLNLVHYEPVMQNIHGRPNSTNFFTYVRSIWLYLLTGFAMFFFILREKPEKSWVYIPISVFVFFAVSSTVFSQFPKIAFLGDVDRNEGLLTQLCYMAILFLSINLCCDKRRLRLLLRIILVSATILSILGALQFFGYDFFYGGFADRYLIPDYFRKIAPDFIVESMGERPAELVLTFGNGNYTGVYMAMLFSLTLGLIIGLRSKINFWLIPLHLLLFVNLVGSRSRAAAIAATIAFFVMFFLFRSKLKEKAKLLVFLMVSYLVLILVMNFYSLHKNKQLIETSFSRNVMGKFDIFGNFDDLKIEKNQASVVFDGLELKIRYNDTKIEFYNQKNELIPHRLIKKSDLKRDVQKNFSMDGSELNRCLLKQNLSSGFAASGTSEVESISSSSSNLLAEEEKYLVLFPEKKMRGYVVFAWPQKNVLQIGRGKVTLSLAYTEKGFQILDQLGRPRNISPVESFGFSGYERFGSSRGYIWSRTLPMLKKTLLIGFGPDTFVIFFPNHDYLGKLRHISKGIQRVIDKPHNMYLHVGVETGVISLLSILYLFAGYFYQFFSSIKENLLEGDLSVYSSSVSLGLLAYLVAALFNDSIISIAPVFWALLGMGISLSESRLS